MANCALIHTMSQVLLIPTLLFSILSSTVQQNSTSVTKSRSDCSTKTCDSFSQECLNGECVCITSCLESFERVCTNTNLEYPSRCHFYQDQCNCKNNEQPNTQCRNKGVENSYIIMYRSCSSLAAKTTLKRSSRMNSDCHDYMPRLARWLNYVTQQKLQETYVSTRQMEEDDYTRRLYENELLIYAPFRNGMREKIMKNLTIWPPGSIEYDERIPLVWHCVLDEDSNGNLDDKELSQLYRILLPADKCIKDFLNDCKNGASVISLKNWQSSNCFRMDTIKDTCEP